MASVATTDRAGARNGGASGVRVFASIQSEGGNTPSGLDSPRFPRRRLVQGVGRPKIEAEARSLTNGGGQEGARGAQEGRVGLRGDLDSVDETLGSAEDLMADDSPEWVDLNKFGSIFTHHGSSLYLRLGALCKLPYFVCILTFFNI